MKDIKALHRQAMEQTDLALAARREGEATQALLYFRQAYDLETQAAANFISDTEAEPTRSVLLRSAASLAIDCDLLLEAEKLICTALSGNPPIEIAEELRDMLEQVYFQRHLELRGITLGEAELQMSIAGNAVGYGVAPTEAFIERVEQTEKLLYRTAERKLQKPYRDRGHKEKNLQESLELYMSTPRAASFAVTFKVGKSTQLSLPGLSLGEQVIDELLACLEMLARDDEKLLKARINDDAYYTNFVALAKRLAPDGQDVNLVGFTTLRHGQVRKVALTATRENTLLQPLATSSGTSVNSLDNNIVQVVGILKMADARKKDQDEIQLIDDRHLRHTIVVPPGMMSDIVKPLWDTQVVVTGVQKGKRINLQDIRPLNAREAEGR